MSVFETTAAAVRPGGPPSPQAPPTQAATSPFAAAVLTVEKGAATPATVDGEDYVAHEVTTPFAGPMVTFEEADLEAEAFEALRAEFEDEEFAEALEALGDEAAARHLTASATWGQQAEALQVGESEATQWMESVAARADHLLTELEGQFADRPAGGLTEAEIDAVAGYLPTDQELANRPLDAQELFLGRLVKKVKKVVKGVGKLVKKGVRAVGKLLPLGKLFGVLKKIVRPLLERVLKRAIGKLPPALRPAATKLAAKFGMGPGGRAKSPSPGPTAAPGTPPAAATDDSSTDPTAGAEGEDAWGAESLADELDSFLAEAVLSPSESVVTELLAEFEAEGSPAGLSADGPYGALDAGRQKLTHQLLEAQPGRAPIEEMEEFVPVVMAAMKLIKLGVKVIGRKRVVGFVAKLLATLIQGMVGRQAATLLSRPVADAGLRLLGLEAEGVEDGTLGAEALVATAEDTIRDVMSHPAASLENELLLESLVHEAFASAAARHFPAEVLRPELVEEDATDGERGIWVLFPRRAGRHFRYKKYSVVHPVRITRAVARSVTFSDGETLEDRLLDAGTRTWPVQGEVHHYELMPGAEYGHLAAFELEGEDESYADGALEFEELTPSRPNPLPRPRPRAQRRRSGPAPAGRRRAPGTRAYRLKVKGVRLRPRPPFSLRLDVSGPQPALRLHLHVSERNAHRLVGHLEKKQPVQVVALLRGLVGPTVRQAIAGRLGRKLAKRGITVAEGVPAKAADAIAEAIGRTVAGQLASAAAELTTAAKDPAAGVTLTFAFTFDDKAALASGTVADPALTVRSGQHRD